MSSFETVHLDTALALSQIGDAEATQGMLAMLEETLGRDVPHITELLRNGDVVAANHLLHPLKGFIPIFCRQALCDQVAAVEALSKHGDSASVAIAYEGLRPELELLLSEVSSYLNGDA
jgi:hypothetical protein